MWTDILAIMFLSNSAALDPAISAATFISACKSVVVHITGVSFVDDTGLGVTSDYEWDDAKSKEDNASDEGKHTVQKIHTLAQHWERLIFATGGSLNLQKGFWYLIAWKWSMNGVHLDSSTQSPASIKLTSSNNNHQETLP